MCISCAPLVTGVFVVVFFVVFFCYLRDIMLPLTDEKQAKCNEVFSSSAR